VRRPRRGPRPPASLTVASRSHTCRRSSSALAG
jgi:hypothetical protein